MGCEDSASRVSRNDDQVPCVAHVIQRLAVGGLENGLVNLINDMPEDRYRHVIVCLTDVTEYSRRITKKNVPIFALNQRPGQDYAAHWRFLKLLHQLRPTIVHTRNLAALEFQLVAALAGVPGRIHGEHGREMYDLDGANAKYNLLRKAMRPFVRHYTAVSIDLAQWLANTISVGSDRVTQIYNGVDTDKFQPRRGARDNLGPEGFLTANSFVVGTIGRMEPVKDQLTLVRAFIELIQSSVEARERLRLVLIGEGALRRQAIELLTNARLAQLAWLPGERADVPELIRSLDLFVLPSLREGISNTILEAMASGLPVIATRVGGNPELVDSGNTGELVPHSDPKSMAAAIENYFCNPTKGLRQGMLARCLVERRFGMERMVEGYLKTYDAVCQWNSSKSAALSVHA